MRRRVAPRQAQGQTGAGSVLESRSEYIHPAVTSITAIVENGTIQLPKDTPWKSGTVVRVEPVEEELPTLLESLQDFDGMADDLPANLDHYVHGYARP